MASNPELPLSASPAEGVPRADRPTVTAVGRIVACIVFLSGLIGTHLLLNDARLDDFLKDYDLLP